MVPYSDPMTLGNHPEAAVIELGSAFAPEMRMPRRLVETASVASQTDLRLPIGVGFADPYLFLKDLSAATGLLEVEIGFLHFELRVRLISFLLPAADYLPLGRKVPDSLVVRQRRVGYYSVGAERYPK